MTVEDFNEIRIKNGLRALPSPYDARVPCLQSGDGGGCSRQPQQPDEGRGDERESEPMQMDDEGGEGASGEGASSDISVSELIPKILALEGRVQIDKNGREIPGKLLSKKTASDYAGGVKRLAKMLGCDIDRLGECIRDTDKVIREIERRYPNTNTRKTYLNMLFAPSKYLPEYKAAVGEALEKIRDRMLLHTVASSNEAVELSGTGSVESMESIYAKVPAVKEKFGAASAEYIAALLQTNLTGLRGELGTVRVVRSERIAKQKYQNYYVRDTGKLVINDFKTKQSFPGYQFTLKGDLKAAVALSLQERPRSYLLTKRSEKSGPILKRALGVGVNDIRHSMISMMVRERGMAMAKLKEIAASFKHSVDMTLKYIRNEVVNDD